MPDHPTDTDQDQPVENLRLALGRLAERARAVTKAADDVRARPPQPAARATGWGDGAARSWTAEGAVAVEQVLSDAVSLAHAVEPLIEVAKARDKGGDKASSSGLRPGLEILARNLSRAEAHARDAAGKIDAMRRSRSQPSSDIAGAAQPTTDDADDVLANALDGLYEVAAALPTHLIAAGERTRLALEDAWASGDANAASFVARQTRDRWQRLTADVAARRGA